jgi:SAM-dependent methyltransferase
VTGRGDAAIPGTAERYGPVASGYSDRAYADPVRFHGRRARLVETLGPRLEAGDRVLDLGCADAGIAGHLLQRGFGYHGIDGNPDMVGAARRRVGARGRVELGDMNSYRPAGPVQATLCFNAIYYATDRPAFLRRLAGYTEKKFVFDLNPRRFAPATLRSELRDAGFDRLALRAFFVPQTYALPRPLAAILNAAEHVPALTRLLLAFRFTYICAAFRR